MKIFFKLIFSVALLATLALSQTIKVGTNATYPPFEFIDEQNKISGFDMDLIDEISKIVGFKYEIVNLAFDALIPALKAGKIDIIASAMSATPVREKAVDFSKPYYNTMNLFIKSFASSMLSYDSFISSVSNALQSNFILMILLRVSFEFSPLKGTLNVDNS